MNLLTPQQLIIGHWYRLKDGSPSFELVAVDDDQHCIEVQYYDGTIGEIEITTALLSGASRCASPVDVSGAFEGAFEGGDEVDLASENAELNGAQWHEAFTDQLAHAAPRSEPVVIGTAGRIDEWNADWA